MVELLGTLLRVEVVCANCGLRQLKKGIASFENARRFQNSQNIIYGGRSPLSAERPQRLSSNLAFTSLQALEGSDPIVLPQ